MTNLSKTSCRRLRPAASPRRRSEQRRADSLAHSRGELRRDGVTDLRVLRRTPTFQLHPFGEGLQGGRLAYGDAAGAGNEADPDGIPVALARLAVLGVP